MADHVYREDGYLCDFEQEPKHVTIFSPSSAVIIGLDSMMYPVREGESVTATVSVMSDDVILERDVVVTVMTTDGTATTGSDGTGIVYYVQCVCSCMLHMYMYVWCWSGIKGCV